MLTDAWYPLRTHKVQSEYWRCDKRFIQVTAGRGSGKTEIAKRRLVRNLPAKRGDWSPHRRAYCGPTRPQAKRIAWDHFQKLIPSSWIREVNNTDLIIETIFDSELHVVGMDRPQRIEGDQWDEIWIDESSDQKDGVFNSVRPALTHRLGILGRIGIPKRHGPGARDYRKAFERGLSSEFPDYASFTWPSWDILPGREVEEMRAEMAELDYLEQIGGSWQHAGGLCFYAFDRLDNVRRCEYDPNKLLIIGCDFNVNPMAWVVCHGSYDRSQTTSKKLNMLEVVDELWLSNTNTQRSLDTLWSRYKDHRGGFVFIGDASSKARHTSASSSDYIQIKQDKRFNARVRFPASNPPVRDRLAACNAVFRSADHGIRCYVDPSCIHLIDDLENRAQEDDGLPDDSNHDSGHITDALGYVIHQLFPMRRPSEGRREIGLYAPS